jgi:hypothetical protein
MDITYSPTEEIYEPFNLILFEKTYSLQYPLDTEKLDGFWKICGEEEKKVKDNNLDLSYPDKILKFMFSIQEDILKKLDHRFKQETCQQLANHILSFEKKNQKSLKPSK